MALFLNKLCTRSVSSVEHSGIFTSLPGVDCRYYGNVVGDLFTDSAYQEMEREKFAALESKARSDKNVMMSRLLHAAYIGVSESLCDAMVESPVGSFIPLGPGMIVLSRMKHFASNLAEQIH